MAGSIVVTLSLFISTIAATAFIFTGYELLIYVVLIAVSIFCSAVFIGIAALTSVSPEIRNIKPTLTSFITSLIFLGNTYFLYTAGYIFLSGIFFGVICLSILTEIFVGVKQ